MIKFLLNPFSIIKSKQKKDENGIVYASGIKRYASIFVDLIILIIILQCINVLFFKLAPINDQLVKILEKSQMGISLTPHDLAIKKQYLHLVIINQIIQTLTLLAFILFMWTKFSATPGKIILGLRIVDSQTLKPITLLQSLKRFFSLILSTLPFFLGFIWSDFDKKARTWHDRIANTVVVTKKSLEQYYKKQDNIQV